MREARKLRLAQYRAHLSSESWAELRSAAISRTTGFCQLCGDFATQVHHVKYPKQFGHEHLSSLVPACKKCHDIMHGIQPMNNFPVTERMTSAVPGGRVLRYILLDGYVCARPESWRMALSIPSDYPWESQLSIHALELKNGGDEVEATVEHEGKPVLVYRWMCVDETLQAFHLGYMTHGFKKRPQDTHHGYDELHKRFKQYRRWGQRLQESHLHTILTGQKPATGGALTGGDLVAAIRDAIAPRLHAHDEQILKHAAVIAEIKANVPALPDHSVFISIKQGASELGIDGSHCPKHPASRLTICQLAGKQLTEEGAQRGERVISRIEGTSVDAPMNTYRRGDVYRVLGALLNANAP